MDNDIERETPAAIRDEVHAILGMYRELQRARRDEKMHGITEEDVAFYGFDGNDEWEHQAYSEYLRDERGEYLDVVTGPTGDNSHAESLTRHRSMLLAFLAVSAEKGARPLSAEDIRRVLGTGGADRSQESH